MRLYPPVSKEEAAAWLASQAAETWGDDKVGDLQEPIELMAEAMAALSAIELDDELEPLFP